jgi:osmoprotectant transport system ATP-binding protein
MLELRGVSKSYNGTPAVEPLDLAIARGEVAVLLGPSGCGKTTILRMVAGLVAPTTGEITVDSLPLNLRTVRDVRRKLGYVIQEGGLFPHLTAIANVTLMARHDGWPRQAIGRRLAELVEMTDFPGDALARYPSELSGGQRQRLSLIRALFLKPSIVLLDEPLGALVPLIRAALQRDL